VRGCSSLIAAKSVIGTLTPVLLQRDTGALALFLCLRFAMCGLYHSYYGRLGRATSVGRVVVAVVRTRSSLSPVSNPDGRKRNTTHKESIMGHLKNSNINTISALNQEMLSEGLPLQMYSPKGEFLGEFSPVDAEVELLQNLSIDMQSQIAEFQDAVDNASDTIAMLQGLIVNQNGYLELDEKGVSGLGALLGGVQQQLMPIEKTVAAAKVSLVKIEQTVAA
jgi:hypothetical protein